jgi:quercetin dioxygenase-like cupin family protein
MPNDTTPSQTHSLSGLIDYQDGGIVSRTILDKQAGTVTLFAFDQAQRLSEHAAPFDALVQVLEGQLEITIDGSPHQVGQGDIIIMPANKPHSLRAGQRSKMLLVMIKSQ